MITETKPSTFHTSAPSSQTVWVLIVDHRHGTNISLHANYEHAMRALGDHCAAEWDEGLTDQYGQLASLSQEDLIEAYFDAWSQGFDPEWYLLEERPIES